jgi:hypothetical protein
MQITYELNGKSFIVDAFHPGMTEKERQEAYMARRDLDWQLRKTYKDPTELILHGIVIDEALEGRSITLAQAAVILEKEKAMDEDPPFPLSPVAGYRNGLPVIPPWSRLGRHSRYGRNGPSTPGRDPVARYKSKKKKPPR